MLSIYVKHEQKNNKLSCPDGTTSLRKYSSFRRILCDLTGISKKDYPWAMWLYTRPHLPDEDYSKSYYIVPKELSNAINVLNIKASKASKSGRNVLFANGEDNIPIKIEVKYVTGRMSNRNNLIKKRLTSAIKLYLLKTDGKKIQLEYLPRGFLGMSRLPPDLRVPFAYTFDLRGSGLFIYARINYDHNDFFSRLSDIDSSGTITSSFIYNVVVMKPLDEIVKSLCSHEEREWRGHRYL